MKSSMILTINSRIACLFVAFIAPVQSADVGHKLGRVFLAPSERATLDEQRDKYYLPPETELIEETPTEIVEESEPKGEQKVGPALVVNGFVKRAGTSGTVWINGESTYDGDMANMNVDHLQTKIIGNTVRVAPINDQTIVYIKPGQGFSPSTQEITSSYELQGESPLDEDSP